MFEKAKPARDAFTFSLRGMTAKTPFVNVQAIADDRINKICDERIGQSREARPTTVRRIEDVLARYLAPEQRLAATHCG